MKTELLQLSAALKQRHQHLLAQAGDAPDGVERAVPGVRSVGRHRNARWFEETGHRLSQDTAATVARLQSEVRSITIVQVGDRWLGV